jgi:hypothetical protein
MKDNNIIIQILVFNESDISINDKIYIARLAAKEGDKETIVTLMKEVKCSNYIVNFLNQGKYTSLPEPPNNQNLLIIENILRKKAKDEFEIINKDGKLINIIDNIFIEKSNESNTPLLNYSYLFSVHVKELKELLGYTAVIAPFHFNRYEILNPVFFKETMSYTFYSYSDFIMFLINKFIFSDNNNLALKRCKDEACRKYFISTNKNLEYCENTSPHNQSVSCRKYNMKKYAPDEIILVRRKLYNRLKTRHSRSDSEEDLKIKENFIDEDKVWKRQLKTNEKTIEEYKIWLENFDSKNRDIVIRNNKDLEEEYGNENIEHINIEFPNL